MNILDTVIIGSKVIKAIAMNKLFGTRIPLIATILITNRCNLKCVYCYVRGFEHSAEDLDKKDIFYIIDELKKIGTVLIVISGGAPLIRDDVGEIVRYVKSKKMLCEILTSGYMLEKRINDLKNVDSICLSIDGNEEEHDKSRGNGSYKTAIRALEVSVANNILTRIHATVTNNNLSSLEYLVNLAKRYGVRVNCTIASKHVDDESLNYDDQSIRDFYKRLYGYKRKGYPISNAYSTVKFLMNWPLPYSYVLYKGQSIPSVNMVPCKRKDFTCYIDSTGELYPCAIMWKNNGMNVLKAGLRKSWDNVSNLNCLACVTEVGVNLLFNGSLMSLLNVFEYTMLQRLNLKFRKLFKKKNNNAAAKF